MTQARFYSDEVWFYIQTIYEKVDVSVDIIIAILKEETDLKVPTKTAVYKRMQRHGWVKPTRTIASSDRALRRAKTVLSDIKIKKKEDGLITVNNGEKEIFLSPDNLQVLSKVHYKDRNARGVIAEHRRRVGRVGTLFDFLQDRLIALNEDNQRAVDAVTAANKELDELSNSPFLTDDPDDLEFKKDVAEKKIKKMMEDKSFIAGEIGMISAQLEVVESQSRTATNLAKMDFALFGITPDDTKEAQSDNRLSQLKDDTVYDQELEYLTDQCGEMSKRAAWIQSGQFEEEVQQQAEAVMKQQEIEDAEYFEANPDDGIYD